MPNQSLTSCFSRYLHLLLRIGIIAGFIFYLAAAGGPVSAQSGSTQITAVYPDFSSNTNAFQINGSATVYGNVLRITPSVSTMAGSFFWKNLVSLANKRSFSSFFKFQITEPGGGGADGIVFVVQAVANNVGSTGGGIGYSGIANSVGIEFDTWANGEFNDPNDNHVGVDLGGNITSVATGDPTTIDPTMTLDNGSVYYVWVDYDGAYSANNGLLEVRISLTNTRPSSALISYPIDLASYVSPDVYVGFTSATGGSYANHDIQSFYFNNDYIPGGITPSTVTYTTAPNQVSSSVATTSLPADGTSASTISAVAKDLNGNPMAGQSITFSTTLGTVSPQTATTDAYGVATTQVSSTKAGSAKIRATAAGGAYSETTVNFQNIAPTASGFTITGAEDTNLTFTAADFTASYQDANSDPLSSVRIESLPANGMLYLSPNPTALSAGAMVAAAELGNLYFAPDANWNGTTSFNWSASDGTDWSAPATTDLTLVAVDDPPVLTLSGSAPNFTEGDAGVAIDAGLTLTDIDGPDLTGAKISISGNFSPTEDELLFSPMNGISGTYNSSSGILTMSGTASVDAYQAALRSVRYHNTSDKPNTTARQVSFYIGQQSLYFPVNQHFYEFVTASQITWTDAKARTENKSGYGAGAGYPTGIFGMQGYLATITSQAEQDFVQTKLLGMGWLGAQNVWRGSITNEWRWVTGPEGLENAGLGRLFSYQNKTGPCSANTGTATAPDNYVHWGSGEPNDCTGNSFPYYENHNEDYGHFLDGGTWNDFPNAAASIKGYVVEYGGLAGDPSLHLTGDVAVQVNAVDDAPTISDITDQTLDEDGSTGALSFTVSDVDNDASTLTLSTATSNPALAPVSSITLGGTGSSRTITVQPAADQYGSATITVTVADGAGGTASDSFSLTVNPVNDAPVISDTASYTLPSMDEDIALSANTGTSVAAILGSNASDVDGNPIGIAITDWDLSNGSWEFFDGSIWWSFGRIGAPSDSNALLLPADAMIRFLPGTDQNGTGTFTFRAWDQTAGPAFYAENVTTNGGSTPFSAAVGTASITVQPVNDPPSIACSSGVPALAFNGSNGYVDVADLPQGSIGGDFTVEAWVSVNAYQTWERVVDFGNGEKSDNLVLSFMDTSGLLTMDTWSGSDNANYSYTTDPNPTPLNTWVHVAGVADGTGKQTLYVNGLPVATGTQDILQDVARANNYIGRSNWGQDAYFRGMMRDIRIWNVARTQAEIQENMDRALTGQETGLVAYFPMDEGAGTTLHDRSGHQRDGTILGGATWATMTPGVCASSVSEDIANPVRDIRVSDVDAGSQTVIATVSVSSGTLTAAGNITGGLTVAQISGNGSNSLTFTGPLSAINATLAADGLVYQGNENYYGYDTLNVVVDDTGASGSGGALSSSAGVTITVMAVNDAPVISTISDQSIAEEGSTGALPIAVSDVDNDASSLVLTATSDNPTLVPTSNIAFGGSGSNRTVTVQPAANQNGSATIAVTVSDGSATASTSFLLTVSAVNDPPVNTSLPSISGTPHVGQTLSALNGTWNDDADQLPTSLTYTYQWREATDASGAGAADLPDQTGAAYVPVPADNGQYLSVRVTATDDGVGSPASQSTTADSPWVLIANHAPVLDNPLPGVVEMDEDSSPTPFVLSLHATDADGDSLTWEVSSPAHGTASVADGVIHYTPTENYNGSDQFTVTVSDGLDPVPADVSVTIHSVDDAPTLTTVSALPDVQEDTQLDIPYATLASGSDLGDIDSSPLAFRVENVSSGTLSKDGQPVTPGVTLVWPGENLAWMPPANVNGLLTAFTVRGWDGSLASASEVPVTVNVAAVNDPPVNIALPNVVGTPQVGQLLWATTGTWNDSLDENDGFLMYTYQWQRATASNGTGQTDIPGATSSAYTPVTADNGSYLRIQVTASDNGIGSPAIQSAAAGSTWMKVIDVPPTIQEGSSGAPVEMDEDSSPVPFSLQLHASDPDGDALTWSISAPAAHGSASVDGANTSSSIQYVPNANFNGADTFTVQVSDGLGGTATYQVEVTIRPINDPPYFTSRPVTQAFQGEPYSFTVSTYDADMSDTTGQPVSIEAVQLPPWLTLVQKSNGVAVLSGTPANDDVGSFTVILRVVDPQGKTSELNFTIQIANENDAPTDIVLSNSSITENQPGQFIGNLSTIDPDAGDTHHYALISGDTASFELVGNTLRLKAGLAADFEQKTTYVLTIESRDQDNASVTKEFTLQVVDENEPPQGLTFTPVPIKEGQPAGTPAGMFTTTDPDQASGQETFTYTLVSGEGSADNGFFSIQGNSLVTKAVLDFETHPLYQIRVRTTDRAGSSLEKMFQVALTDGNDPPIAQDDMLTVSDQATPIYALDNDRDPEGDSISIVGYDARSAQGGVIALDEFGFELLYTPPAHFSGSDTFGYTIQDVYGARATGRVTLVVNPIPSRVAAAADAVTTLQGMGILIDALSNDTSDAGRRLSLAIDSQPEHGKAALLDNRVMYTPQAGYQGSDSLTYIASDGYGGVGGAEISITVLPVNYPPIAQADSATVAAGSSVSIPVLANDSDPEGESFAVVALTQGGHGATTLKPDQTILYRPAAGFTGSDEFTYTLRDQSGHTNTGQVRVTVQPVNHAPEAVDDTFDVLEDTPMDAPVLANDSDADGDRLIAEILTQPKNGTASLNADGSIHYVPSSHFVGTDIFTYRVTDETGGSGVGLATLNVQHIPSTPVGVEDAAVTQRNVPVAIPVLTNDYDEDNKALQVGNITQAQNGSVSQDAEGKLVYTPLSGFEGIDTFTYLLTTNSAPISGLASPASTSEVQVAVTVFVTSNSVTAQAVDDAAATDEEQATTIDVLSNDVPAGMSIVSASQPAHGSVTIRQDELQGDALIYTPEPGFYGMDSFTYMAGNADQGVDMAQVTVTVREINHAPVAGNADLSTSEGEPVSVSLLSLVSDRDSDIMTIQSTGQPHTGAVTVDESGNAQYTPNEDFSGTDEFIYTAQDEHGAVDSGLVRITVAPLAHGPSAYDDLALTVKDTPVSIPVLANDAQTDGGTLTIQSASGASHGQVQIQGEQVVYTPDPGYTGADTFTYTIADADQRTATAQVNVTIAEAQSALVAVDDQVSAQQDGEKMIDVLANDQGNDSSSLFVFQVSAPQHGKATSLGTSILYVPEPGYSGSDSFTYTVVNTNGESSTASVTVNDQPVVYIYLPVSFH